MNKRIFVLGMASFFLFGCSRNNDATFLKEETKSDVVSLRLHKNQALAYANLFSQKLDANGNPIKTSAFGTQAPKEIEGIDYLIEGKLLTDGIA